MLPGTHTYVRTGSMCTYIKTVTGSDSQVKKGFFILNSLKQEEWCLADHTLCKHRRGHPQGFQKDSQKGFSKRLFSEGFFQKGFFRRVFAYNRAIQSTDYTLKPP